MEFVGIKAGSHLISSSCSNSYEYKHTKDLKDITKLFNVDKNLIISRNNWVSICGFTFNGITLEQLGNNINLSEANIKWIG